MRHHVQEKRKQLKHSHPRSDSDKRVHRPLRYLSWQQKKLLLSGDDNEVVEYKRSEDGIVPKEVSVRNWSFSTVNCLTNTQRRFRYQSGPKALHLPSILFRQSPYLTPPEKILLIACP